jgi:2-polyprenyl-3-methyl-5-hydroxy-6-metoxy-1,4-benzoquinol methylase
MNNQGSLERIIPDQLNEQDEFDRLTIGLHQERYLFAIENGKPGRVLDIACGSGYGSYQIMASEKYNESIMTAVDIDQSAILYAGERYAHPSIQFVCADADHFSSEYLFDTIVSLETIEHLKDPVLFILRMKKLLKSDGILIVSAPVTPSTDGNPHHVSDFTPSQFRKLFKQSGFREFAQLKQTQNYSVSGVFNSTNERLNKTRKRILIFYLRHPVVFFKRVRSLIANGLTNKYLSLALIKI